MNTETDWRDMFFTAWLNAASGKIGQNQPLTEGIMNEQTDTPRTKEFFARNSSFMEKMSQMETLERELTAAREEGDELARQNELFRNETLICADCDAVRKDEYDKAIEQRDRLADNLVAIYADAFAIRDEWLETQPKGIGMVIRNIRRLSNKTNPEPNE